MITDTLETGKVFHERLVLGLNVFRLMRASSTGIHVNFTLSLPNLITAFSLSEFCEFSGIPIGL